MIQPPAVDGRRTESFFQELRRFAPHYTPDLNLSDEKSAGMALMRIFAQLAEIVAVRLDQAPKKHFVAFLDKLGITLLPARAATAAVTFRLASGFEEAVKVPAGTRVTAAGVDDEIPFETTRELLAIPGVLTAAYGVDPLKDLIFSPPLNFLKQEPRTPTELIYEIQSFVAKGSNRLQLNHTTELKPGSFLRIGCKEKKVVQTVDKEGNFVTVYEPVQDNFAEGTIAVPIRNFEVFNGIDRQEHILYIGHASLFTVKEEVEITLEIELKDAQTTLQPLDLIWQFWTKNDDEVPEEEEHWESLDVRSDGTAGLSSSGRVVLAKRGDLEIKPRKVRETESRWIRAQLKEKVPVGKTLPEIETIKVAANTTVVAATGKPGIFADQGFHNATPLDVQVAPGVGFFPFGTEPRQFDQFYVASKEAFSKREADVDLNFDLDLQTLAGPSVIALTTATGKSLRAYSIGVRRRLYEVDLTLATFNLLGNPSESQGSKYLPLEDSIPSAISNSTGDSIYVFVKTEDVLDQDPGGRAGKLWVLSRAPNINPAWIDLGAPQITEKGFRFNPAGIAFPTGWPIFMFGRVFIVGGDGKLHSRDISSVGAPQGVWKTYEDNISAPGQPWKSSPFVTFSGSTILVFVVGSDGLVYRLTIGPTSSASWTALTPTSGSAFKAESRPFAQVISGNDAKVFVVGSTTGVVGRKLFECDTSHPSGSNFPWRDLGQPNTGITTEGDDPVPAPDGYIEDVGKRIDLAKDIEGKHIFLRSADNRLWERLDDEGQGPSRAARWEERTRLGDPELRDSPAVNFNSTSSPITINVASASGRDSIVTWRFEIHRGGPSPNADRLAALLDRVKASNQDRFYDHLSFDIVPTSGSPSSVDIYDAVLKLVRLQTPLSVSPNDDLVIDKNANNFDVGPARTGTDHLLALHPPAPAARKAIVRDFRINDDTVQLSNLDFYSRLTGVVSLTPRFSPAVARFSIYNELAIPKTEFFSTEDTGTVPELSWEYWNGSGWLSLRNVVDGTRSLLKNGDVRFEVPKDIEATEVAGQENFWIRARLVGGDYGREVFRVVDKNTPNERIVSDKSSLRPPMVRELLISYKAKPAFPEACLTFNNLEYLDQTAACENQDSHFPPFETLEDSSFTVFFGFAKPFKTGPVRLLLDAAERNYDETKPPEFAWSFRKDRIWKKLDAEDGSVALTRQGILTVSASEELTQESRFGESLYWIKGSLRSDRALADIETDGSETLGPCGEVKEDVKDSCAGLNDEIELRPADSSAEAKCKCADCNCLTQCSCAHSSEHADDPCTQFKDATQPSKAIAAATAEYPLPLLRGVFLNTVEAIHGVTITEEIVGSGDGEQNQTHKLQHGDVLEGPKHQGMPPLAASDERGEDIRIQEPLSAEERERIERELGKGSVVDREDLGGTWVRWKEVKALFNCGKDDRCYEIDRADGILRFGDGEHGRVVPAGIDNIRAFRYRTGGGAVGNVATNKIEALATAVAGIESVFNPAPAGGGSDKANTDDMLTIGPRRISHGDRAVSVEDFEELALEASRQVAKVRCLGITNLVRTGVGLADPCDPGQLHQALEERGRVSLIIVPKSPDLRPCPSLELQRAVKKYLRDRAPSVLDAEERIIVRPPDYVTVSVYATIFLSTLDKASTVETEATKKLDDFLHPLRGGPEGKGWEFGRPVTRSDIFALLERIADIDRVEDLVFQFRDKKDPDRVSIEANELLASGEHKLAIKKA